MKTAKYETSSGALRTLLATRQFVYADLYTFNLSGGGILRYCTADVDIGYGGNAWGHAGPLFDRGDAKATSHLKCGLDADTWQVEIAPRPVDPLTGTKNPDLIDNQPWLVAARVGSLDGAVVLVDRAYLANWPSRPGPLVASPTGVVNIFTGRVASVDIGRTGIALTLNSHLELLGVAMPRNLYQAGCRFTLFDSGCQLSASSFAVNGTALAGSTGAVVNTAIGAPGGSGTYALGRIVMNSGQNSGFSRAIRSWSPGVSLTLLAPFPFAVAAGDTFTAYPGCDKTEAACTAFANLINFGGMPFIPAPEVAV